MRKRWCVLAGSVLFGCATQQMAPPPAAAPPRDERLQLVDGYKNWTQATDKPQNMSQFMAMRCSAPPSWQVPPSPHLNSWYTVYVNPTGKDAMLKAGATSFPDGTVLVKEKLLLKTDTEPEILTVMSKQDGEWQYWVVDGKVTKADSAQVKTCQSCHSMNKQGDYVFRDYVAGAPQPPEGIPGGEMSKSKFNSP